MISKSHLHTYLYVCVFSEISMTGHFGTDEGKKENMKTTFLICLITIAVQLALAQKYTNKFDNVDVDGVLSNNRILTNYIKCLMEKGPCTPEGRELKKLLPDALQTDCSKCTETQRKNSQKVINFLRSNRPGEWKLLLDKYDSRGVYRSKYEKQG